MVFADMLVFFVIEQLIVLLEEASPTWRSSSNDIEKLKQTFLKIQPNVFHAERRGYSENLFMQRWLEDFKVVAYDLDDVLDEWITRMRIKSQLEDLEMAAAAAANSNSNKKMMMMMMMMLMKKKKKEVFSFLASSLCCCFSSSSSMMMMILGGGGGHDHNDIGSRIREIIGRLDSIIQSIRAHSDITFPMESFDSRFHKIMGDKEKHRHIDHRHHRFNSNKIEKKPASLIYDISDVVCGRAIDKDIIMSRLLGDTSSSSSCTVLSHPIIVSIVGMGGIGKTTLAKLVFNDEKVKKHFEMTMWVCVSDNFKLCKNALETIGQARCSAPNLYEWNDLYHSLLQSVGNKRFLLVLDDVWSEDQNEWKLLMDAVNSGAQGSRILVTTRNERVAKVMNTTYTHSLGTLSDDDCWSLLRHTAFVDSGRLSWSFQSQADDRKSMIEIGFEIAKKCKGFPLAAKTLGRILCLKDNIAGWKNVYNRIREFKEVDDFLMHSLRLSYDELTSSLKECFAYCSIFPKGHEMSKDVLIKLWMAQGLLVTESRSRELEMTGEEYFNNLVLRFFFQDLSKDKSGNIISCKMHDLLHDFAHYVVKDECYCTQYNTDILNSRSNIRHLSLICEDRVDLSSFHASVYNAKHLRTFQLLTNKLKSPLRDFPASEIIYNLKCLRVLCFSKIGLESLSNEVGGLIHLRYLDLSGNCKLRELPESIANLYNLQTLELKGCRRLCKLPKEMGRMINLRHLNIENTPSLSYLPQGFGKLSSLRTLSRFIVSEASKGCTIEELKDLNHLKGKIKIEGLDGVKIIEEASKAELKKKKLWGLILDFKGNDEGTDKDLVTSMAHKMDGVLACLEPHPDLKELEIRFYLGFKFPRWIVDSPILLPCLNSLVLQDCINCTKLPDSGHLRNLETLIIHRLHSLNSFDNRFSVFFEGVVFPKLQHLEICDMKSMEMWNLDYGEKGDIMPCIRYVRLGCQKLQVFPALWKLASLETLKIETTGDVKHIGPGFCCDARKSVDGIAFPMLKHLEVCDLKSLEVWDLGDGEEVGKILPSLSYLKLSCNKLKAFPALWKLPSLETLEIGTTGDVKHIGVEFHGNYGICADRVAFPKLKELRISGMNLEVWDLGNGVVRQIMPFLRHIELDCPKMKVLPALGELQSLEVLGITAEGITKIGSEFYRNGCDEHATRVAFPNLKELYFRSMSSLEVWDLGEAQLMPCLRQLKLNCPNLKAWPALERLPSLEVLDIVLDEEETHIGCQFYGRSTGERLDSWYEKTGGVGLWRIRRRRNH